MRLPDLVRQICSPDCRLGALVAALGLAGCGRKSGLDAPPMAAAGDLQTSPQPGTVRRRAASAGKPVAPHAGQAQDRLRLADRLSRPGDAPLCLSGRRAARRGRRSRRSGGGGRHPVLLLFDRDHRAALSGVHPCLRGCERARLLRHEGELESGRHQDAGAARAPARTWSRKASSSGRARPAFRRKK